MSDTYICEHCGKIVEPDEMEKKKSWLTERDYETLYVCPNCHRDELVEAQKCKKCGEYHAEYTMNEGYCPDCAEEIFDRFKYDPKGIYDLTKEETEEVELNAFLTAVFSTADIEEILINSLVRDAKFCKENNYLRDYDWIWKDGYLDKGEFLCQYGKAVDEGRIKK